jgi:HrpA-like RNA helicase
MHQFRQKLPATRYRDQILTAISRNKVTIVTGGTGCGKTTQVPQFLLEEFTRCRESIRIVCTQPRRLPAISI